MTLNQAATHIKSGTHWTLVMLFPDGEFGAMDATTRCAEHLMQTQSQFVVGIYQRRQWRYLAKDAARINPAWQQAA